MFNKILIANRGDQRQRRAAAKLNGMTREACAGVFTAEINHV